MRMILFSIALLSASAPAFAATSDAAMKQRDAQVDLAIGAMMKQDAARAARLLRPVVEAFDADEKDETRAYFCTRSPTETLLLMGEAAAAGKSAAAFPETRCTALFLLGFNLIDLGKADEARPYLEKAVELAPHNSQYLAELAEWHKTQREWQVAQALFRRARDASAYSSDSEKAANEGRAIRGIGFTLIEMGKLDEAEAMFNEALKLDPNDSGAKNELGYIAEQRAKS